MDELQISGKRFISSRRIARENGYTQDYVGQLIRAGKVVGQKVGRAWYVDALSFASFLGNEGVSVIGEQPEIEVATAQAAPVAIQVETEVEKEVEVAEIKKEEPVEVIKKVETQEVVHRVPLRVAHDGAPPQEQKIIGGLRYYADDEPLLPEIRPQENESRIASTLDVQKPVPMAPFAPVERARSKKVGIAALVLTGVAVFVCSALVSSGVSLNLNIEAGNAASSAYSLEW